MQPSRSHARTALLAALVMCAGCEPRPPADTPGAGVYRGQERFGLSFEERMAVPAELSRLRATAQARAAEIYDPFRSKEDAIRNEEYFARINKEMRAALLEERNLNEAEVAEILAEYQASMGAELR